MKFLMGLDISLKDFWSSFEEIVNEFSPRNKALLAKKRRYSIQN